MAEYDRASTRALVGSLVEDARGLIQDEITLARAEIRDSIAAGKRAGISFGAAALLAVIGAVLLCTAAASGMADLFDIPAWVAYGALAILLVIVAWVLMSLGKNRLATIGVLPRTRESLRENMEWIRSKSNGR